ncbi:MAG TPA: diacylglycerol kinase family protein [Bacteroidia bacterium]|jgi:diacylglycerol kinase
MENKFSATARLKSFGYAFKGLKYFFGSQPNALLQSVAAAGAVAAGFLLNISHAEWLWIIACIGFVLFAEMTNTAVEYLADVVSPGHHEKVGKLKDIAAGAVLTASMTALIIGLMIFVPHIKELVSATE